MHELCKKGKVSYGYPMGMVWVSYGKTSTIPVQYQYKAPFTHTKAPAEADAFIVIVKPLNC